MTHASLQGRVLTLLAAALCLAATPEPQTQSGYLVVVHVSNPVTELTPREVGRLFQKKVTRWENGQPVIPVDLTDRSPVRAVFSEAVHGRSVNAIKAHWQRQIFSGREVPPLEQDSEQAVLEFVRTTPNAVGYVGADTPLGERVKVVPVRESD